MKSFQSFINSLKKPGANVIIITDIPEQFLKLYKNEVQSNTKPLFSEYLREEMSWKSMKSNGFMVRKRLTRLKNNMGAVQF